MGKKKEGPIRKEAKGRRKKELRGKGKCIGRNNQGKNGG
jgi:hypothetical protein